MSDLHARIRHLGRRYELKARAAERNAGELRARMAGLPRAYDDDAKLRLAHDLAEADADAEACQEVADEAASGYILAHRRFMDTGRFYAEDDGADAQTFSDALREKLVIWPDSEPGEDD